MALIGVTGDHSWPPVTPSQGGQVHRYNVIVNGFETTLLLSDADAAQRGLTKVAPAAAETKVAKAPANKARKPSNKSTDTEPVGDE